MDEQAKSPSHGDAPDEKVVGVLARYAGPEELKAAAKQVRKEGYTRWDCYSPFPVHGIDPAMGIRRTKLPWLVLAGGIAGGVGAIGLQWWTNAVDYPIIIGGKPFFSLPANIPVTFEVIVLLAAFAAFFGVLAMNKLPTYRSPFERSKAFQRVTTDGFFVAIDAADSQFDQQRAQNVLHEAGAQSVEVCHAGPAAPPLPQGLYWIGGIVALLLLVPLLAVAQLRYAKKEYPWLHPAKDMDFQPKYKAQQPSNLFADGLAMRQPVEGTVPRVRMSGDPAFEKRLIEDDQFYRHFTEGVVDGWLWPRPARSFPVPITEELMDRGQERYNIYCATCHGYSGSGDGVTTLLAKERQTPNWNVPPSLYSDYVDRLPVGSIFQTITNGVYRGEVQAMPAYASQIPPKDRWAIILYVRALRESYHASLDEIPPRQRAKLR